MKPRSLMLPLLSTAGIVFAFWVMGGDERPATSTPPVSAPARSPFAFTVAGAGILEAGTENLHLALDVSGVITAIVVRVGQEVKAGDVLLRLDDRDARAGLDTMTADLRAAEAALLRLESMPRPEDLPPVRARMETAEALLLEAESLASSAAPPGGGGWMSREEVERRQHARSAAKARVAEARAELDRLSAGAWSADLAVARAAVEAARARQAAAQVRLEKHALLAPVDGSVLQLMARPGEYVAAGSAATPPVILGDRSVLRVRVDVDENDAWRVRPGARARASLRGNSGISCEIDFQHIEPYVVPKQSLTGEAAERIDTRVLQVVYTLPAERMPGVFPGQLVDVFIEADR